MTGSLDRLLALASAPAEPIQAGRLADFAAIEASLGTRLPSDFKLLMNAYGTGSWLNFYWTMNPLDPRLSGFWLDPGHREMEYWRRLRHEDPELVPYPIWPDAGGLLIWGGNENGGTLFWLTEGDPDMWPTVATEDRTPEYHVFGQPCTDLLLSAITESNAVLAATPWDLARGRGKEPTFFSPY